MQPRIPSGRKNNQCWCCFACRIQGANYLRKLWKSWVDVDFPTGEEGKTGLQVMAHGPPSVEMSHQWLYCRKFCFQSFRLHEDRAKISSEDLERRPRAKTSSEDLERRSRAKTSSEDLERRSRALTRALTRAKISSENSSEDLERIGGASNDWNQHKLQVNHYDTHARNILLYK